MDDDKPTTPDTPDPAADEKPEAASKTPRRAKEIGGPKGPEPTRHGDWEVGGRCSDF